MPSTTRCRKCGPLGAAPQAKMLFALLPLFRLPAQGPSRVLASAVITESISNTFFVSDCQFAK
eukprot:1509958-Amphidinium_carterae.1